MLQTPRLTCTPAEQRRRQRIVDAMGKVLRDYGMTDDDDVDGLDEWEADVVQREQALALAKKKLSVVGMLSNTEAGPGWSAQQSRASAYVRNTQSPGLINLSPRGAVSPHGAVGSQQLPASATGASPFSWGEGGVGDLEVAARREARKSARQRDQLKRCRTRRLNPFYLEPPSMPDLPPVVAPPKRSAARNSHNLHRDGAKSRIMPTEVITETVPFRVPRCHREVDRVLTKLTTELAAREAERSTQRDAPPGFMNSGPHYLEPTVRRRSMGQPSPSVRGRRSSVSSVAQSVASSRRRSSVGSQHSVVIVPTMRITVPVPLSPKAAPGQPNTAR